MNSHTHIHSQLPNGIGSYFLCQEDQEETPGVPGYGEKGTLPSMEKGLVVFYCNWPRPVMGEKSIVLQVILYKGLPFSGPGGQQ